MTDSESTFVDSEYLEKAMKVFVTKGFPLWYAENNLYITTEPVEVEDSEWLQAQIAAGLVGVVEDSAAKPKVKT